MSKRLLIPTALASLAVSAVPALAASGALPFTATAKMHLVSSKNVKSNGNGDYVVRGPVKSTVGPGTATYNSKIDNGKVSGTIVAKFKQGTVTATTTGQFKLAVKGKELGRTTGSGRIISGTGAYKGAKGTFTFTGVSFTNLSSDMTIKGSVKLGK